MDASNNVIILIAVVCAAIIANGLLILFIAIPYRKASQARS